MTGRGIWSVLVTLGVLVLVTMTVVRFLHVEARWAILLASFSSYAALGFLVVLVGCLLASRGARRLRWPALTAGVAVLGLAVQAFSLAPLFTAAGRSARPNLTVMTSNLEFGGGEADVVVRAASSGRVDVLVLEEVTPSALSMFLRAGLAELLPYRQGSPSTSASGTMVFARYRLGSPLPLALGNGGLDVEVLAPRPFRLLAVHTSAPVGSSASWLRDLGALRVRAALALRQGPAVLAGDFNATLDHAELRSVLGAGVRDAAEEAGSRWQPTWPSRYTQGWLRPLIAIDHVLVSHDYLVTSTRTVSVPGTDHLALVAELRSNHQAGTVASAQASKS